MSKVIDSMWFNTTQGSFGIILSEDETTGERKLYAGVVSGLTQAGDEEAILSWGNKVNLGMLGSLLARAKKEPDLLEACKAQHDAIDLLFAKLIQLDPTFYPSKSGQPWAALQQGNAAIKKTKGEG
ncbi:hypothetical protein LCGC14_2450300 [marine sediment metagenome]|uniref:Uncharacterized protein n=1 Tax=marine sediment metagenome TaxID=412755 RepID=A0A0F9BGD1_9ZZZZ